MKFEDFSPAQQRAISESGHNVIVSAGAGSGKTEVLTHRVIHFISKHNYKLEDFLILTFTRLAAGVMKSRIRKALLEINSPEANNVDFADISTFDAYALNLVKKYHLLLNVPEGISLVDSTVIAVQKRKFIDEIFEELYLVEDSKFIKMISDLCFKSDDELRELALRLYENVLLQDDSNSYLENYIDNFYCDKTYQLVVDSYYNLLKEKSNRLKEAIDLLTMPLSEKDDTPIKDKYYATFEVFFNSGTYDELIANFPTKLPFRVENKTKTEVEIALLEETKKARKNISDYIKKLPPTADRIKEKVANNREYAIVLVKIVKELDKRIKKYKEKYNAYEFSDIAKMSIELAKNHPDIRDEIKNKLKMIMIDEYQDTSSLQETFVNLIANNNVYMVGDIKQSIYRFRNADCKIFKDKYNLYKSSNEGVSIDLNANFRSRQEVLDDINYIFKKLMSDPQGGANYSKEHVIEFGNKNYIKAGEVKGSRHSSFIYAPKDPEKEAEAIAKDIIKKINSRYEVMDTSVKDVYKLRPTTFSDFAILMDRGSEFDTYIRVFNNYHIPMYVEYDENISSIDIVLVLASLIKIINCIVKEDYDSYEFKKSFASLARSFVFEYSDDYIYQIFENKTYKDDNLVTTLKSIIDTKDYKTNYELIEKAIYTLNFDEKLIHLGDIKRQQRYLETFMKVFNDMSKLDYTLDDFISYLKCIDEDRQLKLNLPSVGTTINSVRMMNIHKSKGLEFNIVYYPGLYKGENPHEKNRKYNVSKHVGLVIPCDDNMRPYLKDANNYIEGKDDESERIRLFYVALTRAREKMIFILNTEDNNYEEKNITQKDFYNSPGVIFNWYIQILKENSNCDSSLFDEEEQVELKYQKEDSSNSKFIIDEYQGKISKIEPNRASKTLNLEVSKKALEFGNKIHFIMEVVDFNNPNYDAIKSEYYSAIVKNFLSSDIVKNIKNGEVYKEYEYYDENSDMKGVIDLLIIYQDHIDIIDYKTKNIDDEAYEKQLGLYKNYIAKTFNKETNTYLYSLLEGKYKLVK